MEREIEDLTAVIADASPDGTAYAHGVSSGGALLLRAIARGAPVRKASVMEPPYRVEGAPPAPQDYRGTLRRFIDSGDRGGAVEYFMTQAVGLPIEAVAEMKATPTWGYLQQMAHTLLYDAEALGGDDHVLPTALLASIRIPVLAVASASSAPWLASAAEAVARAVPTGRYQRLEGGFHDVPPAVLAPALATFTPRRGESDGAGRRTDHHVPRRVRHRSPRQSWTRAGGWRGAPALLGVRRAVVVRAGAGEATGVDKELLDQSFERLGAVIGGRRTYEAAEAWGGKNPWGVPFFISPTGLRTSPVTRSSGS